MDFTVQLPTDPMERRRQQNRIAQRKFRQKKQHTPVNPNHNHYLDRNPNPTYLGPAPFEDPFVVAHHPHTHTHTPIPTTNHILMTDPNPQARDLGLDLDSIDHFLLSLNAPTPTFSAPFPTPPGTAHTSRTSSLTSPDLTQLEIQIPPIAPVLPPAPPPAHKTHPDNPSTPSLDSSKKDTKCWLSTIHIAAQKGHERILSVLLQRGNVDPNTTDSEGRTPLFHAAVEDHEPVLRLLLAHGGRIGILDCDGRSVLHWAVLYRRLEVLRVLLDHWTEHERGTFDIDAYDHVGWTPLHLAVERGFEAGVLLLIQCGADMNAKAKRCVHTGRVIPFSIDQLIDS